MLEHIKGEGYLPYVIGGGLVAATLTAAYLRSRTSRKKSHLVDAPKDVLILRQIPRGPFAPSLSSYDLKLETYLRMAKIPYKNIFSWEMSPLTKKVPWAQLNGRILTDSQFIIEHVNKHFKVDTMSHLSASDRAVAHCFRKTMEDSITWPFARWRWELDTNDFGAKALNLSSSAAWGFKKHFKKICYMQGIGRLSLEDNMHLFRGDLLAVSTYLGDKQFLMGDKPCEVDCAIFGILAQFKWLSPDSPLITIMNEFPNLHAYCDRMKETIWPDWDECITHGNTKEA